MVAYTLGRYYPIKNVPRTYYVDATGGDDGNNGLSPVLAWQTITKVNAASLVGDSQVLFNRGDTFVGRIIPTHSGIDGHSIIYGAYGIGDRPIIDGSASNALYIYGTNEGTHHLRFENIDFSGAYNPTDGDDMAVARVYGHDLYFYYCDFRDAIGTWGSGGVGGYSEECYNQTYDHCKFYNNNENGLYLGSPTSINAPRNCLVVDCEAYNNGLRGLGHGLYVNHGVHVLRLHSHNNGLVGSGHGHGQGIKLSNLHNTDCVYHPILEDSYIHDNWGSGIYVECAQSIIKNNLACVNLASNIVFVNSLAALYTTSDDSICMFNIFINTPNMPSIYWEYPDGHGVIFENNTIIQDVQYRHLMNVGNSGTAADIAANHDIDYNIYYYYGGVGAAEHSFIDYLATTESFNEWKAHTGSPDAHSTILTALPGFVARYTDMRPTAASNLNGLGVAIAGYELDYNGETRADPPTPGCYIPSLSISGTILDGSSNPIAGVTVTLGTFSAVTIANGTYTINGLSTGSSGNLTPSKAGYTFAPSSTAITAMSVSLTGEDFTATINTYTISGTILVGGSGLSGVNVALGAYSANTIANGTYTITGIPYGTSGNLTPTKVSYGFDPVNIAVSAMTGNLTGEDFTAAIVYYTISGTVTDGASNVAGVLVTLGAYSDTTAANGTFTIINIPGGTSGNLIATKNTKVYAPFQRVIAALTGNLTGKNFTEVLYYIRHEGNNLTEYNSTATDGGHLSTAAPGLLGSGYKMDCYLADTNLMYGAITTVYTPTAWRQAFSINPASLTMANNDELIILKGYNDAVNLLFVIRFIYTTGAGYQIKAASVNDSAGGILTSYYPISAAEHTIEICLIKATGAGANNGSLELMIDGVSKETVTGVDNDVRFDKVKLVRFGIIEFTAGAPTGHLYLDELVGNDKAGVIGLAP